MSLSAMFPANILIRNVVKADGQHGSFVVQVIYVPADPFGIHYTYSDEHTTPEGYCSADSNSCERHEGRGAGD
jgi:hypothetical protein